ncbi:5-dehydro-4-deoxyglucarate dehydratase [Saccharopolyspora gloriosae]|uniref:Probable 5-dehydro-4-deoxyglucarate dehydratase n=1 Tax=Saccharopolyspora gloriosae TaxID=455344 RepID=A0A840NJA9_9PSEU|nr:5-dehydro-4-deoxyglucarate dehydratase [Saccharopolyspora gloriosae]
MTSTSSGDASAQDVSRFAARLGERMDAGVLSFPLTSFTEAGELDLAGLRTYLEGQAEADPAAFFIACGTGEFFSLTPDEYSCVVRTAVEVSDGRIPVLAGVGYGWAVARQFAERAVDAGAAAGLLMPHYLVKAPQDGLVEQVRKVAEHTSLPLIAYQRDYVRFSAESAARLAEIPTVVGIKDGHSDLDGLQRIKLSTPADFLFFNGAATAEMQARAYSAIGISPYSSAVHAFAPEIAKAFFAALRADEQERVDELLREFYFPLVELRDREAGYAVSLVKAGARLRGLPVGPVRAPLVDPSATDIADLDKLIKTGLALVDQA